MAAPLFPPASLRTMRMLGEANLPHTCQIRANTNGGRVGGVASESWADLGAPVSCLVRVSGRPTEQLTRDQMSNSTQYEVVLPITVTTVTRKHRLLVSGEFEGVAWSLLLAVEGPRGPKLAQVMRRYLCTVVSGAGA